MEERGSIWKRTGTGFRVAGNKEIVLWEIMGGNLGVGVLGGINGCGPLTH